MKPRTTVTILFAVALAIAGCSSRSKAGGAQVDPWSSVDVGSVFEIKSVTRLEQPFEHQTETTIKQTLIAKNDAEATVKLEISEGSATTAQERKIPLKHEAQSSPAAGTVTTSNEK